MFRGFITGWPQRYASGKKDAIVPIVAYDAFSKLAGLELSERLYDYMANDIGGLERLYRGYVNRQWRDIVGGRHLAYSYGIVGSGSPLVPFAWGFDDINAAFGGLTGYDDMSTDVSGSWSFWLKTTTVGSSSTSFNAIISGLNRSGTGGRNVVGINSAGKLRFLGYNVAFGDELSATSGTTVTDGELRHVVVTGAGRIFINGQDDTASTNSFQAYMSRFQAVGGSYNDVASANDFNFVGELQDLAYFNSDLTEAQARTIYELGSGAYAESTTTCAEAILDLAAWPALRAIGTNTYGNISYAWPEGSTALEALQMVARTEQGRMFVARDGDVTLLSRYSHQLDTVANTIQRTFSDDGSDSNYQDIGFDYDDLQVRNDIRISTTARLSATAEDATSITDYARQTYSVSNALASQDEVDQMAAGLLYWFKDPQVRSLPMTTTPQLYSGSWATILGLDLGHRVRFELTAPGAGSQTQQSLILEQLDWDIQQSLWTLTVQGSPIPANAFILDTSELDGTDVLGF
jgi:hypothetical protein